MNVQYSDPILVAAATAVDFDLFSADVVDIGVVFYSTAEANAGDEIAAGSGTRDIAVKLLAGSSEGHVTEMLFAGGTKASPTSDGGNATALPARTLITFALGVPCGSVRVASAAVSNPGGAVSYRIVVVS